MMKPFKAGLVALSLVALGGCATLVTPQDRNLPLKMALEEPVDSLRQKAEAGDRPAQYALSFLTKYGLRGVEKDPLAAESLRAEAGRTFTTAQAIYVPPATKGGSGSVMNMNHTHPGISDGEAQRLDMCGAALMIGQPALGGRICGSAEAYAALLPAALAIREDMRAGPSSLTAAIDPQAIETCEATEPLWNSAVASVGRQGDAKTIEALDRIIALCGENERSWSPRAMRAEIHLRQGDPAPVVALVAPIPVPADGSLGGYGAVLGMLAAYEQQDWDAHARLRDRLSEASMAALSSAPNNRLEAEFEAGGDRVSLFKREGHLFPGIAQSYVAVVRRSDPRAPLIGYAVTHHDQADISGYFIDEYSCQGRSTLYRFERKPTPADIEEKLKARLSGQLEPLSATRSQMAGMGCQWPAQIAPGFGNDPVLRQP